MRVDESQETWRKSGYSQQETACVEVAYRDGARVRDTKDRDGGTLDVSPSAWQAFTRRLSGE